jgi:hypothetical protein
MLQCPSHISHIWSKIQTQYLLLMKQEHYSFNWGNGALLGWSKGRCNKTHHCSTHRGNKNVKQIIWKTVWKVIWDSSIYIYIWENSVNRWHQILYTDVWRKEQASMLPKSLADWWKCAGLWGFVHNRLNPQARMAVLAIISMVGLGSETDTRS